MAALESGRDLRVLARAPAADKPPPDGDFIISEKAMELVEQRMLMLYQALPRDERVDLEANGTVAIGMVTEKTDPNNPRLVYTTAKNRASPAFREAAERVGLFRWVGDAGVVAARDGPARQYPVTGPPPPGTGGIEHAEQLMIGWAEDHGYVVHGMAVSRRLCPDCPSVVRRHKGGRMMISVIPDPEDLPNPREGRSSTRSGGVEAAGAAPHEQSGTTEASAAAGVRPTTYEGRGEPVVPIAEPAAGSNALKGGLEGAATMILSMQMSALRSLEAGKAVKRLEQLSPEIERHRNNGMSVTVTLVVEVPDQVDIAAVWAGIGDPSQVVYYHDLYIASVVPGERRADQDHHESSMRAAGTTDYSRPPWYLDHPRHRGSHLASRDLYLQSYGQEHAAGTGAFRTAGIAAVTYGSPGDISLNGLHRWMIIPPVGAPVMGDDDSKTPWAGTASIPSDGAFDGRFERTTEPRCSISSRFTRLTQASVPILIESAIGHASGLGGGSAWKAEIIWTHVKG